MSLFGFSGVLVPAIMCAIALGGGIAGGALKKSADLNGLRLFAFSIGLYTLISSALWLVYSYNLLRDYASSMMIMSLASVLSIQLVGVVIGEALNLRILLTAMGAFVLIGLIETGRV